MTLKISVSRWSLKRRHALDVRTIWLPLVFILWLTACGGPVYVPPQPLEASDETTIEIRSGTIVGGKTDNGARAWLGIPYAAPPIGDLRWRPPQIANTWEETFPAVQHGTWCPQITNGLDALSGLPKGEMRGDENCLFLDIYAPSGSSPESELPVMFWIHGGSNVWGRAEQYDGARLAETQQVVVVVAQYRLGPLGWFAHPALEDGIANFALLDLVMGLEWVAENIHAFGGNPARVTLFGESAGGNNVLALLAMPDVDGLYRAAIVQSALPSSLPLDLARNGIAGVAIGAVPAAETFTADSDPDAEDLRTAPLQAIFSAFKTGRTPTVIQDGHTLPAISLGEAVVIHQSGADIPVILGSNRDEAKYLLAFDPAFTKKVFGVFPKARDAEYYDSTSTYMTGLWRVIGVSSFASELALHSAGPVRTYRFDWDEAGSAGPTDLSHLLGAAHSLEVPFVFGRFSNFLGRLDRKLFTSANESRRIELSEIMMACWGQFAHQGSGERIFSAPCQHWPVVSDDHDLQHTMVFDTTADGGVRPVPETLGLDALLDAIDRDPALDTDDRRCDLVERLQRAYGMVASANTLAELAQICDPLKR
ncbi:carboxylesterase family protein [Hyphomonas oceanitis]|uniref:carboxylesterase family protein n=1 Tax=Hyphomonas oceanitis TaxID=81033 RepID=UPI000A04A5B7|nr:carboxylesterase family protein [Hyphomonas oceanitis]